MTSVFVIGPDNLLTEFNQTDYESEDLFQELLGNHPAMLRTSRSRRPDTRLCS